MFTFGSPRLVWLSTLVNVPSRRKLIRSVMGKTLLRPDDRLTVPGPTMEPTPALPNRPIGLGNGPVPLPVVQAVPGTHPGYPGQVNEAGLTHKIAGAALRASGLLREPYPGIGCDGRHQSPCSCRLDPSRYRRDLPGRSGSRAIQTDHFATGRCWRDATHRQPGPRCETSRNQTAFRGRPAGRRPWSCSSDCGGCRRHCRSRHSGPGPTRRAIRRSPRQSRCYWQAPGCRPALWQRYRRSRIAALSGSDDRTPPARNGSSRSHPSRGC